MNENRKGLSSETAQQLLAQHGKNKIETEKKTSLIILLISQYANIFTTILFLAATFSLFIREFVDAFFIALVLLINGLFGFIQEFRAEKTLEKLRNLVVPAARVLRDGEERELSMELLVPADVVILREGDRIPADGKLISTVPLEVDESIFTGESLPVEKKHGDTLLSGTFVVQGRGEMEVVKTGMTTRLGEIAEKIQTIKKPKTPLAQNLDVLGKRLAFVSFIVAYLILLPIGILQGRQISDLIVTIISLSVAVIPEGLPLIVTIALAVGAYRMAKEKTIVRRMVAIETLGSTTVILTDKTGTLTQNKMQVKKHWVHEESALEMMLRAAILGNTASIVLKEDGGTHEIVGDKTDGALLEFVDEKVPDFETYREAGKVIGEKPFDPVTKIIEVEWEHKGKRYEFVRGAPETVISLVKEGQREKIGKKVQEFASEGLRVIAFAYRKRGEKIFTSLGVLAIYDPPRLEAERAILEAKGAGIRVVMVTGDNPITAKHIAEDIQLIEEGDLVLTHAEIEKLPDEELKTTLAKVRVFARMQPEDKLRLVNLYKSAGYVVAVTGDGVNDSLALAEANIGVAMGKTGTDVAKEAADVVITDDNLYTIVRAIEEGRGIFDNIIKVVVFLLSSNIAEFLVIFLGILLGLPIPLTPTQILWVNLISDGFPALVLAVDTKRKNLLKQPPRNIAEQILNNKRLFLIAKMTLPFSLLLLWIYATGLQYLTEHEARLLVFNALVIGEMILVFIARGGILPWNRFLILSVIFTILLQILVTLNPFLRNLLS